MDVSRTTWTILAVFTLGAFFFTIVTFKIVEDPPSSHIPGGEGNSSLLDLQLIERSEAHKVFANGLDIPHWTTGVETLSFVWLAVIIIYSFTLLCRRSGSDDNDYLYCSPPFWNPWIFVFLIFAFVFQIGFTVSYSLGRRDFTLLFALLAGLSACLTVIFSFVNLQRTYLDLLKRGFNRDVIFNVSVVQNGIGFYAWWLGLVALQHLNVVLSTETRLNDVSATSICLAILTVDLIVYFAIENFYFNRACRYYFAPYVVVIWFLLGVLVAHWDEAFATSIFALVVICLSLVLAVIKMVLVINRARDDPLANEGYQRL